MSEGNKAPINIRLSPEGLALADKLKSQKGISRTAVIELAIRAYAKQEGVELPGTAKSSGE